MKAEERSERCAVCGATGVGAALVPLGSIRPNLAEELHAINPKLRDADYVCTRDVQRARTQHVERLLQDERGELTSLERDVLSALSDHELLSEHPQLSDTEGLSFGERLSDKLAGFGGSWRFILL